MSKSEKGYTALDEETIESILDAFRQVRGDRGFTEDDALKVLDWATLAEVNYAGLTLIKDGLVGPDLNEDGEVTFWPLRPPTLH